MRQLLARWNPTRDVWEVETMALFSEHLDVFSETWPISGSMRSGEAFRHPTSERPIDVCAYSSSRGTESVSPARDSCRGDDVLFRTPCAAELDGGALTPEQARERGQTLRLAGQVEAEFGNLRTLPTPSTIDGKPVDVRNQMDTRNSPGLNSISGLLGQPEEQWQSTDLSGNASRQNGSGARRRAAMLPTPTTSDGNGPGLHGDGAADLRTTAAMLPTPVAQPSGNTPEEHLRKKPGRRQVTDLAIIAENGLLATGGYLPTPRATRGGSATETAEMLPTPKAADGEFGLPRTTGRPPEKSTHLATRMHYTDFGDYTAAVQRWEAVTGRPALAPTKPNPKTGKQQLSAEFVEWMMGLPHGWFTSPEIGLSRPQQFRIAGNGVVPQQGHAALAVMLDTALTKEETA